MAGDKRLWAKIDLGYLSNLKMSEVLDNSSTAPLMHLASILHCAQHLTDGHASPRAMQRLVGGSPDDVDLLIRSGLWHAPGHECDQCPQPDEGRIYVHNYLDHNVSSKEINDASERGRKAANARWENRKNKPKNAKRMQSASDTHANGMQSAMLDQIRSDDLSSTADAEDDTENAFNDWYKNYPRKEGKGQARKAFKTAIKKTDLETLKTGLDKYLKTVEGKEKQYIAMPATWLNGERWDDDYSEQTSGDDSWNKLMNWTRQN